MKNNKIIAAVLAAGMMMTNFAYTEAAMTQTKKAVKVTQTAGRQQLGEFAPDFARYNDDILFGEVWSKNDILSLHDRSIVTVSALVASGMVDSSLKYHLQSAKKNGVTKEEMAEVITQLGFYAGWPKAWAAFNLAKEVYNEPSANNKADKGSNNMDLATIKETSMFPVGGENVNYAQYFDGKSYLNMISMEQVVIGNVTFEPGCRNHWHIHHAAKGGGQMLLVTAGRGWYQEWGKPAIALTTGMVIDIPEGVKHWHGAQKDSWLQHYTTHVKTGS
jgi:alkylhydroperoxidase/carboxymuconolactone decarboxylase family protein YurZ/uncharacterized RmlC-like cupin family protein